MLGSCDTEGTRVRIRFQVEMWERPRLTDQRNYCVEPAVFKITLAWSGAEFFLVLFFAPNLMLNLISTHTEAQTLSLVPSISLPCFAAVPWMLWIFAQS